MPKPKVAVSAPIDVALSKSLMHMGGHFMARHPIDTVSKLKFPQVRMGN